MIEAVIRAPLYGLVWKEVVVQPHLETCFYVPIQLGILHVLQLPNAFVMSFFCGYDGRITFWFKGVRSSNHIRPRTRMIWLWHSFYEASLVIDNTISTHKRLQRYGMVKTMPYRVC